MEKITIQKMAKELGLSRNTVSLALRESNVVSESTRRQVVEYARKAGYFKNFGPEIGQGPRYHVMVLRRPNDAAFWDKVMSGIMKEAREENCLIQMAVVLEEDVLQSRLPIGYHENIDAFLFVNIFPQEYIQLLLQGGKIGIFLDGDVHMDKSTMPGDMIKSEGIRSVHCITRQLISQGLKRIIFFSSVDVGECQSVRDRLTGYQQAMQEENLPMTTLKDIMEWKEHNVYNLEELADIINGMEELPEAFVCSNDVIAARVVNVLRGKGVKVPGEVAVSGFDNEEERNVAPFITTADFHGEWLGRRLIMQMMWRLAHPEAPHEVIVVDSEVIFRRSTEKRI